MTALTTLAAAVLLTVAGAVAGWGVRAQIADADLARLHTAHVQAARDASEAARAAMARAQQTERGLLLELHATQEALDASHSQLKGALDAVARRDHQCLSADTVGLLNRPQSAALPTDASSAADAPAVARAATGRPASEYAVAEWIMDTRRAYDACRARIDALRAWDEVTYGR